MVMGSSLGGLILNFIFDMYKSCSLLGLDEALGGG